VKKFWLWYNSLEQSGNGGKLLRFMLFMYLSFVCWVLLPAAAWMAYGRDAITVGQMVGALIMLLIALNKLWCTR
jgi:hypothetical protein